MKITILHLVISLYLYSLISRIMADLVCQLAPPGLYLSERVRNLIFTKTRDSK